MKQKVTIPFNSALAILDRAIRKAGVNPRYLLQEYIDTMTGKKETGLILDSFEGYTFILPEGYKDKLGILGFVNGEEPGEGSIPLHEVFPKEGDNLAMACIIQGIYKGDFSKHDNKEMVKGLYTISQHTVTSEDLHEQEYNLDISEVMLQKNL